MCVYIFHPRDSAREMHFIECTRARLCYNNRWVSMRRTSTTPYTSIHRPLFVAPYIVRARTCQYMLVYKKKRVIKMRHCAIACYVWCAAGIYNWLLLGVATYWLHVTRDRIRRSILREKHHTKKHTNRITNTQIYTKELYIVISF